MTYGSTVLRGIIAATAMTAAKAVAPDAVATRQAIFLDFSISRTLSVSQVRASCKYFSKSCFSTFLFIRFPLFRARSSGFDRRAETDEHMIPALMPRGVQHHIGHVTALLANGAQGVFEGRAAQVHAHRQG
jgi:hypothetical protein